MRSTISTVLLSILFFWVQAQEKKPLVVVELFTSEGCSSCPPADRLLSSIVNSSDKSVDVLGLSFHVDYWDYIGWKDPYAQKAFTIRQRAYARRFGLRSIYTPQMVVNGKHEFVGSSKSEWNKALVSESKLTLPITLEVSIISKTGEAIVFTIKAKESTNSLINVAIVEKDLSQEVKRGENRGKVLSHNNVVRSFDTRSFDGKPNKFTLHFPQDLKIQNASLIVYSQDNDSWQINAAKKINITSIE